MENLKVTEQTNEYAIVEGYGVLFNVKDLEGETFTPQTDYATDYIKGQTVYLDHAQDDIIEDDGTTYHLKAVRRPVGEVVGVDVTDAGLYFRLKLKKAAEYWDYVSRVLSTNKCGLSTGTAPHLMEKTQDGIIKMWHVKEISLTMTPAESRTTKYLIRTKTLDTDAEAGEVTRDNPASLASDSIPETLDTTQEDNMSEEILKALAAINTRLDQMEAQKADPPVPVNDPGFTPAAKTVNVVKDTNHWRYDRMSVGDLAALVMTMDNFSQSTNNRVKPSDAAVKALAMRLESTQEVKGEGYDEAVKSFRGRGLKANEMNQSTLTGYGAEWVGTAFGTTVWEKIRQNTMMFGFFERAGRVFQAPRGADTFIDPLESTDPTVYSIGQGADYTANPGGVPVNTVPIHKLATDKRTTTLGKFGSASSYTGELDEDSFIDWLPQLRMQTEKAFTEAIESCFIDGDTTVANNTNINYIVGTPPTNKYYLAFDGIRKLALVTNSAQSTSIGGALAIANFITVAQLLGDNGKNADLEKTVMLVDPATYWKALQLTEVKTKDVNSQATVESGILTRVYGYNLYRNAFIAWEANSGSYSNKTNAAGKVDYATQSNNTKGQIIAFRPDQWKVWLRYMMKQEITRHPRSDSWEIVTTARMGFNYRDTSAAAIGYNITV